MAQESSSTRWEASRFFESRIGLLLIPGDRRILVGTLGRDIVRNAGETRQCERDRENDTIDVTATWFQSCSPRSSTNEAPRRSSSCSLDRHVRHHRSFGLF